MDKGTVDIAGIVRFVTGAAVVFVGRAFGLNWWQAMAVLLIAAVGTVVAEEVDRG